MQVFGLQIMFYAFFSPLTAYLLADAGYDVWMGNARGTEISRQHVTLDPEKEEFWAYSWQHIGQKDLPAFIDYILEKTQYKKVTYVGYSQGRYYSSESNIEEIF